MGVKRAKRRRPLVSVIMPAHNSERYIEAAICSVFDQTVTDWELIVIDDASTDATADIVRRLAGADTRIHLLTNEENLGPARSRNRGLDACQGRFVALLDSDDLWHPEKLERQLALAEKTGADVIYCSYGIIDGAGRKLCGDFLVPETTNFDQTLVQSVISCSTALLRRPVTEQYRFRPEFYHEDLALWLTMLAENCRALGIREVLAEYRVADGSRACSKLRSALGRWEIYRSMLHIPVIKSVRLLWRYSVLGFRKYKKAAEPEMERAYV